MVENTVYLTIIYDYYKKLLTEKQCLYFEDYYFNNLTLSEMSENYKISRSAVNKQINITIKKINDYESKLNLYKNSLKIKELTKELPSKIKEQIEILI